MMSLVLLFTIFLVSLALVLHLAYMALNDTIYNRKKSDDIFEEVSIQDVIHYLKPFVRLIYKVYDRYLKLISIQDPALTLIAFLIMHLLVVIIWVFDLSVWGLIWLIVLVVQLK